MSEGMYQSIYNGEQHFHPDFFTSGVLLEQLLLFFLWVCLILMKLLEDRVQQEKLQMLIGFYTMEFALG